MTRLPTPGGDDGSWGGILNSFLSVEHNADGTLKNAVPKTRTVNGHALSGNVSITSSDVGLGNVQDLDQTDPGNITQDATHRFATDAEKSTWNGITGFQTLLDAKASKSNSDNLTFTGVINDVESDVFTIAPDGLVGVNTDAPTALLQTGTNRVKSTDHLRLCTVRMTDVSQSIDVNSHQGYTTEGTFHYVFDNNRITKYDASWVQVAINSNPLASLGVDHLGDGCYYDGKLYIVAENYPAVTSMMIAVFNASDLSFIEKHDTGQAHEVSSCTIVSEQNAIYVSDFFNSNFLYKYDLTTFAYNGSLALTAGIATGCQGIYYRVNERTIYMAAHATGVVGQMYRVDLDGNATVIPNTIGASGMEGFDYSQGEIRWLFDSGAGNKKVHYITVDYSYGAVVVPENGDIQMNNALAKLRGWDSSAKNWSMGSDGTYVQLTTTGLGLRLQNADLVQFIQGYTWVALPQSTSVGKSTAAVNSAQLEVVSTSKGFLPPRMTTTQRDAISSPAEGLVIYNTTTHKLNVFTTVWEAITSA